MNQFAKETLPISLEEDPRSFSRSFPTADSKPQNLSEFQTDSRPMHLTNQTRPDQTDCIAFTQVRPTSLHMPLTFYHCSRNPDQNTTDAPIHPHLAIQCR